MKKRVSSLMLAAVLAAMSVTACSGGKEAGTTPVTTAAAEKAAEETKSEQQTAETPAPTEEKAADGSVDLTVTMPLGQWTDNFDILIEAYKAEHPELGTIAATFTSTSDYNDLLKAAAAAGELPDIIGTNYGEPFKEWNNYMADLSTDFPAYELFTEDQKTLGTVNGKVVVAPIYLEGTGILYNMALLEKAGWKEVPKTRDELKKLCEDLTAAGIQPFMHQWAETNLNLFNWVGPTWLGNKENGGLDFIQKMLSGEDMDLANDPEMNEFLDYYDIAIQYAQPNATATDKWTARNAFFLEEAAMLTGEGSWEYPNIMNVNPDLMNHIKQDVIPCSNDADKNHLQIQTMCAGVSSQSKNVKAAKDFLSYIRSSEAARVWHQETMGSPTSIVSLEISDKLPCIAVDVLDHVAAGKASESMWEFTPAVLATDLEEIWSRYVNQQISREDFTARYAEIFKDYAAGKYN